MICGREVKSQRGGGDAEVGVVGVEEAGDG